MLVLNLSSRKIHTTLHETFLSGKTRPLAFRRGQLLALARMFQENAEDLMNAAYEDLGRHKMEVTIPEMGPVVGGALRAAEKLEEWVKPEKPAVEEWRASWDTTIYNEPKGAVVIISWVIYYNTGSSLLMLTHGRWLTSTGHGTTPMSSLWHL
jgi:aldehyde dehydrogenase (NAD+)